MSVCIIESASSSSPTTPKLTQPCTTESSYTGKRYDSVTQVGRLHRVKLHYVLAKQKRLGCKKLRGESEAAIHD